MTAADWCFRSDGTTLHGLRWDVEQPAALVYLVHGLAEHVARYDSFATALNQAGFMVAGHDQRGHDQQRETSPMSFNPHEWAQPLSLEMRRFVKNLAELRSAVHGGVNLISQVRRARSTFEWLRA